MDVAYPRRPKMLCARADGLYIGRVWQCPLGPTGTRKNPVVEVLPEEPRAPGYPKAPAAAAAAAANAAPLRDIGTLLILVPAIQHLNDIFFKTDVPTLRNSY